MAITNVSLARVSQNLRAFNLLEAMRANQSGLFGVQTQIATGLRFLRPSEAPVRGVAAMAFDRRLGWMEQVETTLGHVNGALDQTDTSMQEALSALSEAHALAIQSVGDTISEEERHALATIVDGLLDQVISIGNRSYLNTYLFAGKQSRSPFELAYGGVHYRGDDGRMSAVVDIDLAEDVYTTPGSEFFGAVSSQMKGTVDLDPRLTSDTRVRDLNGALGRGVTLGVIQVTSAGGTVQIDLSGADTAGDLVDLLNAALPPGLTASLDDSGIALARGDATLGTVTIEEVGAGRTAADLGVLGSFNAAARAATDLDPRITRRTRLADLRGIGVPADLSAGFRIRLGGELVEIDLNGAETVEDLLNRINYAGVGTWGRIGEDGRTLDVLSRVSGADLTIEENGGRTATALGLRSMQSATRLADLNDGRGVRTADGPDLRITTADGTTIEVDLDGSLTLGDVVTALNDAGGGAISVSFASQGNGLVVRDLTVGPETLRVVSLNDADAAHDLGLDVGASGDRLNGRDVNPIRTDSPFTALIELRDGMERDDRDLMVRAAQRMERVMSAMQQVQGRMASRAQAMDDRAQRVETERYATQIMLSDVRDVDLAEAAVRFQQLQTALQASFSTAAQVLNLSLLDYLR